ncbi:MAG: hypothetical protein ACRBHB_26090 [Arenicella sp.]
MNTHNFELQQHYRIKMTHESYPNFDANGNETDVDYTANDREMYVIVLEKVLGEYSDFIRVFNIDKRVPHLVYIPGIVQSSELSMESIEL